MYTTHGKETETEGRRERNRWTEMQTERETEGERTTDRELGEGRGDLEKTDV